MSFVGKIAEAIFGSSEKRAYELLQRDMQNLARRIAELEYTRTMAIFYRNRAAEINPLEHWWDFAEAKEAHTNYDQEWTRNTKLVEEARARVEARREQFNRYTKKDSQG